ncbi:MAG: hypothetical protein J6J56_05180 [Rikenellaceae bacterium]|nr:hypothetical protein [Rikenellaceae bacterium]
MTEENQIEIESTQPEEPSIAHDSSWQTRLSRALSWLLHPFVVPLYVLGFMLLTDGFLSRLPASIKSYLAWIVVLYAAIVPMLSIAFMRGLGLLKNFGLHSQQSRLLPLLVGAISYVLCAITLSDVAVATIIRKFVLAAACCEVLALIVTPFWKISLHLICMGGVTAVFTLLSVAGAGQHFWALVATILLSGALASARLHLGAHNPSQIAVGYFGGLVVAMLAIMYL